MIEKLKKIIERIIDESKVVMVITKPDLRAPVGYNIIAELLSMGEIQGLYVSLNIPHITVERKLQKLNVNTSKLIFIDCITASLGIMEEKENVIYLDSPELILLEGAIKHGLRTLEGEKNFVYIDSVSTLLAFNSYQSFIRFLRMITNEIRFYGLIGIIFMLDKELQEVEFSQTTTFVDEIINLKDLSKEDLMRETSS